MKSVPEFPMSKILAALILLALAAKPAPSIAAETDEKDIRAVIESFRTAIVQHDKDRFLGLFVSAGMPWQGVMTDDGLALLRQHEPKAAKVAYDSKSTPAAFIESILRNKRGSEEKFSNLKIDTDGDVATASADYEFLSGGRKVNWGRQSWLLVRAGAGWKITTLAFSSNLGKEEPKR